jgi:hypothetical protein
MNVKKVLIAVALVCLICIAGTAQSGKSGVPSIISIENGYGVGYNFDAEDIGTGLNFTLGLSVADNLQVLLSFVNGDTYYGSYRLFGLAYDIVPKIGVTTTVGTKTAGTPATGAVAGLGLYMTLLQREVGDIKTALKIKLDYLTLLSNFEQGVLRTDITVSIGI